MTVTECCGEPILYKNYGDGVYEEWEFCANCLDCYDKVDIEEYNNKKEE